MCVRESICSEPASKNLKNQAYFDNRDFDQYPLIYVTWDQASAYCHWVGAGLPTEAQWEYAARGPSSSKYPWDNTSPNPNLANYAAKGPSQVGSFPEGISWVGALDIAGNVWEWVNDWFDGDYYSKSPAQDPQGPEIPGVKVFRGGSWRYGETLLRSAYRSGNLVTANFDNVGFRCASK